MAAVALTLVAAAHGAAASGEGIRVDRGFRVELYATGLVHPTALAWGPARRLYVTEDIGRLVAVSRGTRRPRLVAANLRVPLGLTARGAALYVSEQGRLERIDLRDGRAVARRTLLSGLPYGLHQQDNVVFGTDGRLYLGSGSTCDLCTERDRRSATILSLRPGGGDVRVEASGLRNPYGLARDPRSGRIYVSVNGQDKLGANAPAETVVRLRRGADYGWPRCWPAYRPPRLVGACRGVTAPVAYLEPHSSADGLAFYTGRSFPPRYRRNLFVAEWGQYDSRRTGRKLVRISFRSDGSVRAVSAFAGGFDHPLALTIDARGALLVADWGRGIIYRIQARGKP